MEWFHPITGDQEIPVYIKVAAIVAFNLNPETLHDLGFVQPLSDPTNLRVAKRATIRTLRAYVIWILSTPLVRPDHVVIAVDGGRNTSPDTFTVVTTLNER